MMVAEPAPQIGSIVASELPRNDDLPLSTYELPALRSVTLPPEDKRGDVRAIVEFVDPEWVEAVCAEWSNACTLPDYGTIRMPNPCAFLFERYATMLCHEIAHISGWRHPEEDAESARALDAYKRSRCHAPQLCGDRL